MIHPKRSDESKEYDIAVIILETKPPYTGSKHISSNSVDITLILVFLIDFIRPICLPDIADHDFADANEVIYVTGWGWTHGCK